MSMWCMSFVDYQHCNTLVLFKVEYNFVTKELIVEMVSSCSDLHHEGR